MKLNFAACQSWWEKQQPNLFVFSALTQIERKATSSEHRAADPIGFPASHALPKSHFKSIISSDTRQRPRTKVHSVTWWLQLSRPPLPPALPLHNPRFQLPCSALPASLSVLADAHTWGRVLTGNRFCDNRLCILRGKDKAQIRTGRTSFRTTQTALTLQSDSWADPAGFFFCQKTHLHLISPIKRLLGPLT